MSQSAFSISAKQQISVSPRLQQAVRLLQMSALEFQQELQQQLTANPFLEDVELTDSEADDADSIIERDSASSEAQQTTGEDSLFDIAATPTNLGDADSSPVDADVSTLDAAEWNDLPEAGFETPSRAAAGGDGETDPFHWVSAETGLREHLRAQVCGASLNERERLAAVLVIETLDDDGYLRESVEETAAPLDLDEPLTAEEIEAGIHIVQQFDPIGVGARDLQECLSIQLKALPRNTIGRTLALTLASGHLEQLGKREYAALQRRLDCSERGLHQAHGLIRRLDPRPGHRFTAPRAEYVTPDVIVVQNKGKLTAMINPAVMPKARLNRGCVDMLRRTRDGKYPAMQQQLQEARWLLRNAEQRFETIQRVAEAIVARQRAFFQYGEIALKPLILREVADELGLHESTLSRATGNKYMATPRGIFEFKHFFSRQLNTDTGGTCSATAVRALIKEMIEAESREAPLSDVSLAKMLTDHGICVARRTVAKYRNQMKMPPAELRYLP